MKEYLRVLPTVSWDTLMNRINEYAEEGWVVVGSVIVGRKSPIDTTYSVLMEREKPTVEEVWIECRGRGHGE